MNLLNEFLRDPAITRHWDAGDWNCFLPLARNARLLGRCLHLVEQNEVLGVTPQRFIDQFRGALAQTRYVRRQAERELRHVQRVLEREDIPMIALKGVAYVAASLPPHRWRGLSDIDLLVREQDIDRAERA